MWSWRRRDRCSGGNRSRSRRRICERMCIGVSGRFAGTQEIGVFGLDDRLELLFGRNTQEIAAGKHPSASVKRRIFVNVPARLRGKDNTDRLPVAGTAYQSVEQPHVAFHLSDILRRGSVDFQVYKYIASLYDIIEDKVDDVTALRGAYTILIGYEHIALSEFLQETAHVDKQRVFELFLAQHRALRIVLNEVHYHR